MYLQISFIVYPPVLYNGPIRFLIHYGTLKIRKLIALMRGRSYTHTATHTRARDLSSMIVKVRL
jgi:hypothetical protein